MRTPLATSLAATLLLVAAPSVTHADELPPSSATLVQAPAPRSQWGFGARVGGYGFRSVDQTNWNDCHMGGFGLFAERRLGEHFFAEAATDLYSTTPVDRSQGVASMDRISGMATVAAGFRVWPRGWFSPNVEIGGGVEVTRVSMVGGESAWFTLPVGFVGLGADAGFEHLRVGFTFRMAVMGQFETEPGETALHPEAQLAAQGLLFVRYDL